MKENYYKLLAGDKPAVRAMGLCGFDPDGTDAQTAHFEHIADTEPYLDYLLTIERGDEAPDFMSSTDIQTLMRKYNCELIMVNRLSDISKSFAGLCTFLTAVGDVGGKVLILNTEEIISRTPICGLEDYEIL